MRETPTTPKRKLERKQSPSYRSMEKQNLSPWKLILQLTCERIFTRLRPCSTCINRERLPVYALHPQILLCKICHERSRRAFSTFSFSKFFTYILCESLFQYLFSLEFLFY